MTPRWPYWSDDCVAEVSALLQSGSTLTAYRANKNVGIGPREGSKVYELEREIEKAFKVKHAIAVNSGTAALHAALTALDIKDKEVIVSPFSFSASISSVILAGGIPVFADVDESSFCITPKTVRNCITKNTKAIMPVHLFGYFAPLDEMASFGLPIIEDACQAVGASRNGNYSGTSGIAGAYSFNGAKNACSGEGGAIVTNDDAIAEKARMFINHACNFGVDYVGVNYRCHEIVAVLAKHGLKDLLERNIQRSMLANTFYKQLQGVDDYSSFNDSFGFTYTSTTKEYVEHAYYVTPFKVYNGKRDELIKRMHARGFAGISGGYITPSLEKYSAFRRYCDKPLPNVTELSEKTLCLIADFTPNRDIEFAKQFGQAIREEMEAMA